MKYNLPKKFHLVRAKRYDYDKADGTFIYETHGTGGGDSPFLTYAGARRYAEKLEDKFCYEKAWIVDYVQD